MIERHSTSVSNSWVLDTGCGTHICSNSQGLKESRILKHGELNLIMGNRMTAGSTPCNGVYESVICVGRDNNNLTLNVGSFNSELDKSSLWHHRLGHINKKRIAKLQSDGILESFDLKSDEECESCLLGKMTKSPFKGKMERGKDLLDLIHTDVCGPFRSATRHGERYFVTFTDDFSRYGFIYLMKNKSDTFEVFKGFKNEVENQLGKKIKMLRSDRGGEYLSHEFYDYLRDCGIVSQLSPPRTPQLNGVAERRNRTLLDMVRSMMSRATLPMSFWGYALETAAHILNLVPTKKVAKTPSEMAENVNSLVIPANPLDNFSKPSENKVFEVRRRVFLERELISKEDSGSNIDLEEIQETTNDEPVVDTSPQHEVESPVEETNITPSPLHRTSRVNEPSNYKEAMAGLEAAKWKEAMESEIQSMYDNHVWELVDHTPGRKTVGNSGSSKRRTHMDGNVHIRLVAKVTLNSRIDYDETFSPRRYIEFLLYDLFCFGVLQVDRKLAAIQVLQFLTLGSLIRDVVLTFAPILKALKESRKIKAWGAELIMGNRMTAAVTKIGDLELVLSSVNWFKSSLWLMSWPHKQEAHRQAPIGRDLESFDLKSDEECESCLLGKMTKYLSKEKWKGALRLPNGKGNGERDSVMYDNHVWELVDLHQVARQLVISGSSKKKTHMDGMCTLRLVAKGYTQTQGLIMMKPSHQTNFLSINLLKPPQSVFLLEMAENLPPPTHSTSNPTLLSILNKDKLTGPNYLDWIRALRVALRYEDKEYLLNEDLPILDDGASPEAVAKYDKHDMLRSAEANMGKTQSAYSTAPVLTIREGGCKKKKVSHPKGKGKAKVVPRNQGLKRKAETSNILPTSDPKEAICFYCQEKGHWKRSCPKYLEVLKVNKAKECGTSGIFMIERHSTSVSNSWVLDTGCGTHICSNSQGLKESRILKHGELNLIMGNRMTAAVTKIGDLELVLSSGLSIKLLDCCYSPEMARNIISFHALYKDGFKFKFDNDNGCILVYKNDCFYFKATPCNGVYESVICVGRDNNNLTLNVGSFNSELDKSSLWHHRLGHINKKRIAKLQSDGILESFDLKSDEECESCLLGKMTKSPFKGKMERGKDLLDLIHTDVCGPFRSATRHGERYFVTFTDDFSRYGFIYLMKNKSDTFEVFKGFKNEVENQLGKKIKMLRSDRGGEYLSHEFYDYLRDCGIVSQLSPPRTPQLNGVAERRNRTLLDMVRSMMSRATLPMSFWGYALETAAHILNLVPTKKVAKTPSEIRRVFLERELISKEDSGSNIDLEEIQETTNDEPVVDTSPQHEVESPVEETNITPSPLHRTSRVSKVNQAPEYYYGFHITKEGDTLVNNKTFDSANEPSNYKEAMAGLEAAKWKEAMESEIQSMYDNHVWELVDHTPGRKTVGNKWIFKKKTHMDGNVHTQTGCKRLHSNSRIDYDETFSPVAKIKSIRILLAIAAFHDYEIWQMDVKTAFLNGKLDEDVYMAQPEGFVHAKYLDKVCKLKKSIYGLKQASRSWNLCFHERVKKFGFSRIKDKSCVYVKASGSNVVFLILYVGDILLIRNNVPMLQDVKNLAREMFRYERSGKCSMY
ncbi:hypothetical protein OSB04_022147 [Centaurea solstitialis]|uniref:Uncharacterized protein n=1 Tax=Centaurea solstitialis TaxID=347529 RepID=A0AA38WGY3_9ASTR|nr:hypothetical protein OSB04_022147 [Centaurea solstitialis]